VGRARAVAERKSRAHRDLLLRHRAVARRGIEAAAPAGVGAVGRRMRPVKGRSRSCPLLTLQVQTERIKAVAITCVFNAERPRAVLGQGCWRNRRRADKLLDRAETNPF
jgi:hypothetical protein